MVRSLTYSRIVSLAGAFALLATAPAFAQDPAEMFNGLRKWLVPGDTILVTDRTGKTTKGKLGELSVTSLELLSMRTASDGRDKPVPKHFAQPDIAEIRRERPDSIVNGTLIGFTPGAALAVLGLIGCGGGVDSECGAIVASMVVVVGGIGAGVGALIDASMHDRETIYVNRGPRAFSGSTGNVKVMPSFAKGRGGVAVSLRF